MCKMRTLWLTLSLFLLLLSIPPAHATGSLCGPNPVLAPTEYCTFYPLLKTGKDDAIITLSWDAQGPGMQGVPTPSMVGDYYFYFKDGKLYYLGSTLGAYELFYTYYRGLWYLSDGRVINPEKPCIVENITFPADIRGELCPCGNVSITSPAYPVSINGSRLYISNGNVSYTIDVPNSITLPISDNTTLRAVFLGKGALIYARPKNPFVPFGWRNLTVLYYNGSLKLLNFTDALNHIELKSCSLHSKNMTKPIFTRTTTKTAKKGGLASIVPLILMALILKRVIKQ